MQKLALGSLVLSAAACSVAPATDAESSTNRTTEAGVLNATAYARDSSAATISV